MHEKGINANKIPDKMRRQRQLWVLIKKCVRTVLISVLKTTIIWDLITQVLK